MRQDVNEPHDPLVPSPPDLQDLFAGLHINDIANTEVLKGQAAVCFVCRAVVSANVCAAEAGQGARKCQG